MSKFLFVIFKSMTYVLSAERIARKGAISCRIIPIPRNLSTDCGMCISVKSEERDAFLELLEEKGLVPERVEEHKTSGPGARCYSS